MTWEETKDPEYPYSAKVNQDNYSIRLNDFPDESLYTLIVNNEEIEDLEDWPEQWIISSNTQGQRVEQGEKVRKKIPHQPRPVLVARSPGARHGSLSDMFKNYSTEGERVVDSAPQRRDRILQEERVKVIQVISESKSKRDMEVLRRYYINEEDKVKICADLGLTTAAFNTILSRARARLKKLRSSHS